MARYTIAQLEALSKVGQGRGHDTYQHHNGIDTSQLPPLVNPSIRQRIYGLMCEQSGAALPRSEIARLLGLVKSPWLTQAIESLVKDGYLIKSPVAYRNGALMYVYEVKR